MHASYAAFVCWFSLIINIDAFTHQFLPSSRSAPTTIRATTDNGSNENKLRIRAAIFQAPPPSSSSLENKNPLEILTSIADSLRIASLHGVDVVLYPELYLTGGSDSGGAALDRESYELNIIGNMCGELNVASILGYAESIHKSELVNTKNHDGYNGDESNNRYNSIAAFHADGSRAGNYRSVTSTDVDNNYRKGSPFVEFIPLTMNLPNRDNLPSHHEREIKVGMMCGNDIMNPEHSRHLVRNGAQVLFAPCAFRNTENDRNVLKYVIPTRAMENSVPFIFANMMQSAGTASGDRKEGQAAECGDFIGSSAIISQEGEYLVCGPEEEGGDMPCDRGYLIPCNVGALYAADIDIDTSSPEVIQQSIDQWDLNPVLPDVDVDTRSNNKKKEKQKRQGSSNGFGKQSSSSRRKKRDSLMNRRTALSTAIASPLLLASKSSPSAAADASLVIENPNPRAITTVRLSSPNQKAGLELYDTQIGTPPRNVVAVKSVQMNGQGARDGAERGMILLDYANREDLIARLQSGVYPIEIRLFNLALGGDSIGDLGRSMVTPEDALQLSSSISKNGDGASVMIGGSKQQPSAGFVINTIRQAQDECMVKSRRGDTMQIRYEARIGDRNGPIYDASEFRGTGQPYAYILGNNDVIKGVDLGTFDMCPGEVRELTIPPELGYRGGSKLFKQIPPNSTLFWKIELVELNFIREGMNSRPREDSY
jgi:FK506-binding protein 2